MFNSMPKKGSSKKIIKKDIDEVEASSDENENDKTTRFLTNQILKQQKINYKKTVNNFIQCNGFVVLSY